MRKFFHFLGFHKWSNWVQHIYKLPDNSKVWNPHYYDYQTRTCEICNLQMRKNIRDGL